jgi:formylglycine-generating enzyme required for sulfatase activity
MMNMALSASSLQAQDSKVPEGMVLVPTSSFQMGSNQGEGLVPEDSRPQRSIELPAFYIDKTEVTNAEYKKYCDATGYPTPPHWTNGMIPKDADRVPVTHVNFYEAAAYAAWAGKRLPTESEWEKAARGTDGREYPWGNGWNPSNTVNGLSGPVAVGERPGGASPFGALDMAGNVFEWTTAWYDAYPGSTWKSASYGTIYKVIRGGGFDGAQFLYKTNYRCVMRPTVRNEWVGFRCVVTAP